MPKSPPERPRPPQRPGGPGWEYTPPGETPPNLHQGSPLNVKTTYDKSGAVRTELPIRGIDIGPEPDFWGDLAKILNLGPRRRTPATRQAQALRVGPDEGSYPTRGAAYAEPQYSYEPTFGTLSGQAPGYTMPFYNNFIPGISTPFSAGSAPVATGYRRVLRGA